MDGWMDLHKRKLIKNSEFSQTFVDFFSFHFSFPFWSEYGSNGMACLKKKADGKTQRFKMIGWRN